MLCSMNNEMNYVTNTVLNNELQIAFVSHSNDRQCVDTFNS